MDRLTLPEPARGLWAAARDVLHRIEPEDLYEPVVIPPHLGGGTVLAARWRHRASTDIDVILPHRTTLADLLQDNPKNIVDRLGGQPDPSRTPARERHSADRKIDLAAIEPRPRLGHTEMLVDGRADLVLSNTQILRGKLERTQEMMPRDIFDIATAAREDPAARASALNMLPEARVSAITWSWHGARDRIRDASIADKRVWTSKGAPHRAQRAGGSRRRRNRETPLPVRAGRRRRRPDHHHEDPPGPSPARRDVPPRGPGRRPHRIRPLRPLQGQRPVSPSK